MSKGKANAPWSWKYAEPKAGVQRVYANNFTVTPTGFDLRLTLGEIVEADPDTRVIGVEQRVVVTLSWLAAKNLADFAQSYLRTFEGQNGPISPPILPGTIDGGVIPPSSIVN